MKSHFKTSPTQAAENQLIIEFPDFFNCKVKHDFTSTYQDKIHEDDPPPELPAKPDLANDRNEKPRNHSTAQVARICQPSLNSEVAYVTLPENTRKNGFDYTLVKRLEKFCIYRQDCGSGVFYYEVFIAEIKPAVTIMGNSLPAREVMPADEAFGVSAWTFRTLSDAYVKFNLLTGGSAASVSDQRETI